MSKVLIFFIGSLGFLRAELLDVKLSILDMNCESCTEGLAASLKRMRGVEKVEVDFKAGTVALALAAQNRIRIDQVWDAVKRFGFTPGLTTIRGRGTVSGGKFHIPESGSSFDLDGHRDEGENVELSGDTQPPPDPRTLPRLRTAR